MFINIFNWLIVENNIQTINGSYQIVVLSEGVFGLINSI